MTGPRHSTSTTPRTTGPRHIDHDALQVWIFLLKEGGYWQTRELGRKLAAQPMRATVRDQLDRLHSAGMVRVHQIGKSHPAFGVTAACAAPPGYAWMLEVAMHGVHPINWAGLEALHA